MTRKGWSPRDLGSGLGVSLGSWSAPRQAAPGKEWPSFRCLFRPRPCFASLGSTRASNFGTGTWPSHGTTFPLPTSDLQGVQKPRAVYSDATGFSRALLASLADDEGNALLPLEACTFWSEHSDRAGLDGWCAALGLAEPKRGFLGRWAARGFADIYVRTACRVVENLQRLAARFA